MLCKGMEADQSQDPLSFRRGLQGSEGQEHQEKLTQRQKPKSITGGG